MERPIILSEIKKDIQKAKVGTVFVPIDFALLTDKKTASVCLSRLETEKLVSKIMRGVYYKPKASSIIEKHVDPEPDLVAHALARNYGWTIVPCGYTALTLLGLSTQIPDEWVYVSDGTYKEYTYNQTTIKFKRTSNKDISKLSYKTALVVQALKSLGKGNVDEAVLIKLKYDLTESEKNVLLSEAKATTAWIYEYIKLICKD